MNTQQNRQKITTRNNSIVQRVTPKTMRLLMKICKKTRRTRPVELEVILEKYARAKRLAA
jgi:hypothetical protein|tara:strand:+ start:489 stop:668 length:180 start_codon:yes stop_codon:yes gene_type:complete